MHVERMHAVMCRQDAVRDDAVMCRDREDADTFREYTVKCRADAITVCEENTVTCQEDAVWCREDAVTYRADAVTYRDEAVTYR